MSTWSTKFGESVYFLCICVESLRIAQLFRQFTASSINALLDSRLAFPAQLGCSGFIIIDSKGNFITTKSASFLELENEAFVQVEREISALINTNEVLFESPFSGNESYAPESTQTSEVGYRVVESLPLVGYAEMDDDHERIVEGGHLL